MSFNAGNYLWSARHVLILLFSAALYVFYKTYLKFYYLSKWSQMPGPKPDSYILGSQTKFLKHPGTAALAWHKEFGDVLRIPGPFLSDRLSVCDVKALTHVQLHKSYNYPKTPEVRVMLSMLTGNGVLTAEDEEHRKQKKLLAPAFSQQQVNDLIPIFQERSLELSNQWNKLLDSETSGAKEIDVTVWLSKVTLDIIGKAGFGYEFQSLEGAKNRFAESIHYLLRGPARDWGLVDLLVGYLMQYPALLGLIRTEDALRSQEALRVTREESRNILRAKQAASTEGKDLIALLMRANQAADAKGKLSDQDVVDNLATFLLAGHETTATASTWVLLRLAENQDVQDRLRAELREALIQAQSNGAETFTLEQLATLPYLDAVTKEGLRFDSPVANTERMALVDDILPLSRPYTQRDGKQVDHIEIKKGDFIYIPVTAVNHSQDIWGPDAGQFKPSRWLEPLPEYTKEKTKGFCAYSHINTFIGGPRACIGYKFAISELKAIIATLVHDFKFDVTAECEKISGRSDIVVRPYVSDELDQLPRLSLRVTALNVTR